jgi:glycosyltransferase involved in cell wall biosynthesis
MTLRVPYAKSPTIYVDVSDLALRDRGTGIQRVVKNILREWIQSPKVKHAIKPVYVDPVINGLRYAAKVDQSLTYGGSENSSDDSVNPQCNDIYFSLDLLSLRPHLVSEQTANLLSTLRNSGVITIFYVHDILPATHPHYFPDGDHEIVFRQWLKIMSDGNAAICSCQAAACDLRKWLQAQNYLRPGFVIKSNHLGSDISAGGELDEPSAIAEQWDRLTAGAPTFLMVGTLEPRKGHETVLDAFEYMWSCGAVVNLVFAGQKGWNVDRLIRRIKSHNKRGSAVLWIEAPCDLVLHALYRKANCLIAASFGEGFGLPTIEAARFGLPIIARDLPVNREICGSFASYFQSDAAQELARFVSEWLVEWNNGNAPDSSMIAIRSWREAAESLYNVIKQISKTACLLLVVHWVH